MSLLFLTACSSSKVNTDFLYFQNGNDTTEGVQLKEPLIQINDRLNIQVFSKTLNQEQASLFNIPNGSGDNAGGYQVNTRGMIDIPIIGSIKAAGFTREQLESNLAEKLTPYVKEPSVIVRFLQFKVNILGEVNSPGTKSFETDGVTIIDAIGAAGDLTNYGKRKDILVIRNEGGKRVYHSIDLSNRNVFESSVYQLQQNDIVYVAANENKIKALSIDPIKQKNIQLGLTLIALTISIISLFGVFNN